MNMEIEKVKQAIRDRIPEVYEVFASMDDEYVKLVREYHQIASMTDRYTTEFIAQKMQETKKAIKELMLDRLNAAKEVIARIKEDFSEEPQEPTGATGGVERQLERNNNLILWNAQDENFQRLYREAKRNAMDQAISKLQQTSTLAVETLANVMKDKRAPAMARVMAAKTVLELSLKATEIEEVLERVEALERMVENDGRVRAYS